MKDGGVLPKGLPAVVAVSLCGLSMTTLEERLCAEDPVHSGMSFKCTRWDLPLMLGKAAHGKHSSLGVQG